MTDKAAAPTADAATANSTKQTDVSLEGDDTFEEFAPQGGPVLPATRCPLMAPPTVLRLLPPCALGNSWLCPLSAPCAVREDAAAKEDERAELWQADWDDEETTEDFQAKLRQELDRDMKE